MCTLLFLLLILLLQRPNTLNKETVLSILVTTTSTRGDYTATKKTHLSHGRPFNASESLKRESGAGNIAVLSLLPPPTRGGGNNDNTAVAHLFISCRNCAPSQSFKSLKQASALLWRSCSVCTPTALITSIRSLVALPVHGNVSDDLSAHSWTKVHAGKRVSLRTRRFNGHLACEPGSAGSPSLVFFLQLFQKKTFGNKCSRFLRAGRTRFQSPNQQCQSTEGNSKRWPQPVPVARPHLIIICHRHRREGHCASSPALLPACNY